MTTYRDLAEFGLRFVTPADPSFDALIDDLEKAHPSIWHSLTDLESAAVLVNESGKAVITFAHIFRVHGKPRTTNLNLGSSLQMDFLSGRAGAAGSLGTFFLPGSKQLITERHGSVVSFDVLPDASKTGAGFARPVPRRRDPDRQQEMAEIELVLDVAIFEDGLCAGPDEIGLFETLTEDLEQQRKTAREIAEELRSGASVGRAFELLRPLARRGEAHRAGSAALSMYASQAIHHLINMNEAEVLAWFTREAQLSPIPLHRPA